MENASKALIIAGAILISILLISVGIMVMNSINKPLDEATKSSEDQAVQMFNAKFSGYSGQQQAAAIKALMTAIASDTSGRITTVTGLGQTGPGNVQAAVKTGETYTVTFTYGTTGETKGYIIGVNVH